MFKEKVTEILKDLYGKNSSFRKGQYEAIESTYNNPRTLVVQKTGWGKSLIYFITTYLFRKENRGLTVVVSPLLVLMENQQEAAERLHLKCISINSTLKDKTEAIQLMKKGKVDLVFITPESLFLDDIQKSLKDIKIGLFVIDECHCISDWGHDFRLEYGKLNKVINILPKSVHLLATTATANDRVINDLKKQLGGEVFVSRGPLTRESLHISVVNLKNTASRYAWILKNINKLPGSGIIYCLTQRDCDYLSDFLNKNGVSSRPYYSRTSNEELNQEAIEKFSHNKIKAIVSTIKLGMGFDKGDIGFVIHFQTPANIVSYYQQIGRAGRNIDKAYAILMHGEQDKNIVNYFINTAFPTEIECNKVINLLERNNGLRVTDLSSRLNIRYARLTKTLAFLLNEGAIYKDRSYYYISANPYKYNEKHYNEITEIRKNEMKQMYGLLTTKECLSNYVINALDDPCTTPCGKCSNCDKNYIFEDEITTSELEVALKYINNLQITIESRKRWPNKDLMGKSVIDYVNEDGICLSKYGDVGYGHMVQEDKYSDKKDGVFREELVGKSVAVLKPIIKKYNIKYVTCIPSLNRNIVTDFTERLAEKLNIEFIDLLYKTEAPKQKNMENSYYQCKNAVDSFHIKDKKHYGGTVLLIDDVVDSKWTLTVCGYYLMQNNFDQVFPFVLADSSHKEEENE